MTDLGARLRAAHALHLAGELEAAREGYREVLAEDSESRQALHLLGSLEAQCGHLQEARELLGRGRALHPDFTPLSFHLGHVLRELDQPAAALESYQATLALDPEHHGAELGAGWATFELGDRPAGVLRLALFAEREPTHAPTFAALGEMLLVLGDREQALTTLRRAHELAPEDEHVRGLIRHIEAEQASGC